MSSYTIVWTPEARGHIRQLTAARRERVVRAVARSLTDEPTLEARNRQRMRPGSGASWELRVGEMRVYYDVRGEEAVVLVIAVGTKRRDQVYVGGRPFRP